VSLIIEELPDAIAPSGIVAVYVKDCNVLGFTKLANEPARKRIEANITEKLKKGTLNLITFDGEEIAVCLAASAT
jgi:hypothetical protein